MRSSRSGFPVVVGISRKSFLGKLTGREQAAERVAAGGRGERARVRARGLGVPRPRRRPDASMRCAVAAGTFGRWSGGADESRLTTTTTSTTSTTRTTTRRSSAPPSPSRSTGLSLYTHHGVSAAEREVGQRLILDLRFDAGDCRRDRHRPRRGHRRLRARLRASSRSPPSAAATRRSRRSAPRSPTSCSTSSRRARCGSRRPSPSRRSRCRSRRCRSRSGARETTIDGLSRARLERRRAPREPAGRGRRARRARRHGDAPRRRRTTPTRSGEVLDQPAFLNACLRIETELGPEELLDACKAVEAELGRDLEGGIRHGPRPIDVDVLLLGDVELRERAADAPARPGDRAALRADPAARARLRSRDACRCAAQRLPRAAAGRRRGCTPRRRAADRLSGSRLGWRRPRSLACLRTPRSLRPGQPKRSLAQTVSGAALSLSLSLSDQAPAGSNSDGIMPVGASPGKSGNSRSASWPLGRASISGRRSPSPISRQRLGAI